jgi:hypothetical protein
MLCACADRLLHCAGSVLCHLLLLQLQVQTLLYLHVPFSHCDFHSNLLYPTSNRAMEASHSPCTTANWSTYLPWGIWSGCAEKTELVAAAVPLWQTVYDKVRPANSCLCTGNTVRQIDVHLIFLTTFLLPCYYRPIKPRLSQLHSSTGSPESASIWLAPHFTQTGPSAPFLSPQPGTQNTCLWLAAHLTPGSHQYTLWVQLCIQKTWRYFQGEGWGGVSLKD